MLGYEISGFMENLILITSWIAGYGVLFFFGWLIIGLILGFLKLRRGSSAKNLKRALFYIFPPALFLVSGSMLSDMALLIMMKEVNKNNEINIVESSGLYYSKYEIQNGIKNSFLFKYESGHNPISDKYVLFDFKNHSSVKFRINSDNRDSSMFWISVENILGYGYIGFFRL